MAGPFRVLLGAVALGAFSAGAANAAAPALMQAPGAYPVGTNVEAGTLKLVTEPEPAAAISAVQIFVDAGLARERESQSGVSALVAETVLRTPVEGAPLEAAVAARGGSVTYAVDGRAIRYYVEARSADLPAAVDLLGRALAAPDFRPAIVDAGRRALDERIARDDASALESGVQMFRRAYLPGGTGLPPSGSAASLAALDPAAVKSFWSATYVRAAVTATAIGVVSPELSTELAGVAAALPDRPVETMAAATPKPLPPDPPRVISHRDVGAPWIVVGFGAPPPNSADFGPMLVLQALLSDAFERRSTTSLGFVERSVGTEYSYDTNPATFVLYVNGTLVDPSVAVRELLAVSESLGKKPLTATELAAFKTAATGRFVLDSTTLADRSYRLGTFAGAGLGPNALNVVLDEIRTTSAADVRRAAAAYLGRYIIALVLPREIPPTAPGASPAPSSSPAPATTPAPAETPAPAASPSPPGH